MTEPLALNDDLAGARFSEDKVYRYRLWRCWGKEAPACFCMLNPSLADAMRLDPTLTRCFGFSKAWKCGGMVVVNLFGVVSPYPKVLLEHPDPVGPENNDWILAAAKEAHTFVVGWGAFPRAHDRATWLMSELKSMGVTPWCLGVTKHGHPRHPLYIPAAQPLVPYVHVNDPGDPSP